MFGYVFPRSSRFPNQNRDEKLYFDLNSWGFVYIRNESSGEYLINRPTKFPNDAKTTKCERWVSKEYFERFCSRIYDVNNCKYAYTPIVDDFDLGPRAIDREEYETGFLTKPRKILKIFKN